MPRSAEVAGAAAVVLAWVVAGANLRLLHDLKATPTTFAALLVLTGVALAASGRAGLAAPLIGALLGAAVVFAGAVVAPAVALLALGLVLAALTALLARPLPEASRGIRLALAAGTAALLWPPFLGLLSNTVVEVACPKGGVERACHGFYRVGF